MSTDRRQIYIMISLEVTDGLNLKLLGPKGVWLLPYDAYH